MRCRSYVKWGTRRKKGSGEEYKKAVDVRSAIHFAEAPEGYELCDGEVVCVSVRAVDEPNWGGHYAKLEVEYRCGKCGNTFFPELGGDCDRDGEEVAALATRGIQTVSDAEQDLWRDEWAKSRGIIKGE